MFQIKCSCFVHSHNMAKACQSPSCFLRMPNHKTRKNITATCLQLCSSWGNSQPSAHTGLSGCHHTIDSPWRKYPVLLLHSRIFKELHPWKLEIWKDLLIVYTQATGSFSVLTISKLQQLCQFGSSTILETIRVSHRLPTMLPMLPISSCLCF